MKRKYIFSCFDYIFGVLWPTPVDLKRLIFQGTAPKVVPLLVISFAEYYGCYKTELVNFHSSIDSTRASLFNSNRDIVAAYSEETCFSWTLRELNSAWL